MTYEIIFSDKALKQLKKMERNVQERIIAALERVRIRPEAYVTKLVGDPGYRLRVGDYSFKVSLGFFLMNNHISKNIFPLYCLYIPFC